MEVGVVHRRMEEAEGERRKVAEAVRPQEVEELDHPKLELEPESNVSSCTYRPMV